MKIGLSKLKFSFVILFSTLLSISPFNPVRLTDPKDSFEVCAQDINWEGLGSGVSCIPNYSSCPGGYNLLETASSARFVNGISKTQFLKSFQDKYGDDANKICTNVNFSDITIRWMSEDEYNGALEQNIPAVANTITSGKAVPRLCPSGWEAQIAPQRFNFATGYPSGCCPTGFKFVNVAEQDNAAASQNGVCCRMPSSSGGQVPHKYATPQTGSDIEIAGCYDDKEVLIFATDDENHQVSQTYETLEEAIEATEAGNIIVGVKPVEGGYNPFVTFDESKGASTNVIKPQFGLGLGLSFPGSINTMSEGNLSPLRCPNNVGCFVVSEGVAGPRNLTGSDGNNIFDSAAGAGISCGRCFSPGEPIEVDSATKLLSICDPTAENSVKQQPLCNSSVIDTVACLGGATTQSQNPDTNGVYSDNYDLCCACREQGGVWTGIGCTDTTPSGLITGLIRIVYGVMGGVALIMLIYAGIMYQTGNEANVKKARESIIRTVTGLIVLTFSILILRVIGINVLDILPTGSI